MDTLDFLSDSSTDSSSSESDNEENLDDQTFQAAFQEQIAQKASASTAPSQEIPKITDVAPNFTSINTATTTNLTSINTATTSNNVTTSSIFPLTKPKKVKKRPPAPDDFSKLLGIPINEAPKKKIKKLSGVSADREKRAKELEDKYSWCFEEPSMPVHRAVQNLYDIDAIECLDHTTKQQPFNALPINNHKPSEGEADVNEQSMSKSLRIGKMVAADWASSVAPPTEDLFGEQIEGRDHNYQSNSYEDFNKKKNGYPHRLNNNSNKHRHNRSSMDKQRVHHDKRQTRPSHHPRLNHTSTQCPSPSHPPPLHASTQTSLPSSQSSSNAEAEKLNKPDYYKAKADNMKKILCLMSDPVSTLMLRLKLSLLEMQEVVAMLAYRLDSNAVCHRINNIISVCRKNLEEIKHFKETNVILRDALTVITMKLMSFLYHHLYLIRREEVAKAKLTLESFIMRSESREMAERELSGLKTYVMHMEYFGKSFNYLERANLVIKNHKSDFFVRHNFRELYPMNNIFRHVCTISPALIEANRIHDDQS